MIIQYSIMAKQNLKMSQEAIENSIKTAIKKLIPSGYDCVKVFETGYTGLYFGCNNTEINQGNEIFSIDINTLQEIFESDHAKYSTTNYKEISSIAREEAENILNRINTNNEVE